MNLKILVVSIFLLIVCCIIPVSAVDLIENSNDDIFHPWYHYTNNGKSLPIYGSVTQGDSELYSYFVPAHTKRLEIILAWDNSQNSLSITIQSPDNNFQGIYYDNYESVINGIIPIISTAPSIQSGWWNFSIDGYNVSGSENFSLTINAYQ